MSGTLHLIGVGPGDPELMTLKAVRLLDEMPVIAYPVSGSDGRSMALEIARTHLNPHAVYLPVTVPMREERGPAEAAYDEAARVIRAYLEDGRDVAWLCEGDPLFYGSAMYLIGRMAPHAPVAVVPGVTSLTAAAAAIVRPLAARDDMLKVLPATLPDDMLRRELQAADAVALIKIGRHFDRVRALLAETGHADSAMVIEHATLDRQRLSRLDDFGAGERPYFSTILCYRRGEAGR